MEGSPPGRRRSSADQIVETALGILATDGTTGLTMARVARECGISNGSLFHRFESRRALLLLAMDTFVTRVRAEGAAAGASLTGPDVDLETAVIAVVDFYLHIFREHGMLIRAFVVEALSDAEFADRGEIGHALLGRQLGDVLARFSAEATTPDLDVAARLVHRILFGTCVMRLLFHDEVGAQEADVTGLRAAVLGVLRA